MYLKTVTLFCLVALSCAQNFYELAEPVVAQYEEPLYEPMEIIRPIRIRRQIFGGFSPSDHGTTATVGAKGNIFNNNGHSLDAQGQVSKQFKPTGPTSFGAGLDYQGPRGGVSGNANHVRHFGTDVGVTGNANLWRSNNGRATVDATAGYNRHFGGPSGTGRPDYNVGSVFRYRF